MSEDIQKRLTCKQRIWKFLSIAPKGGTRPNYRMMSICFIALMASAMSITFLFAFLPEMITRFGYKEEEKGYYVGLVASAFFIGRAIFSYSWGLLADRFGRKLVLLSAVALHGIFALLFGFSTNITMAFIFRFLSGASNGVGVTTKTILYEISDNTNQAVGMAVISLAWGVGIVVGPALGGYLASPADKYPSVFSPDGFFAQFPYVLTTIPCCVASIFACIVIQWKMTESLIKHKGTNRDVAIHEDEDMEMNINDTENVLESEDRPVKSRSISSLRLMDSNMSIYIDPNLRVPVTLKANETINLKQNDIGYSNSAKRISTYSEKSDRNRVNPTSNNVEDRKISSSTTCIAQSAQQMYDTQALAQRRSKSYDLVFNFTTDAVTAEDVYIDNCDNHKVPVLDEQLLADKDVTTRKLASGNCFMRLYMYCKSSDLLFLLRSSEVRSTLFLYAFFQFGGIGFEDVYTIWASTHPRFDGLGFNTDQLGTLIGTVSIPLLVFQLYLFPYCANRFGIIKTFVIWNILFMVIVTALPMTHLLIHRPGTLWTVIIISTIMARFAANCCHASMSLLVNNSIAPEYAGRMNGITVTFAACFRSIAPVFGGSVFAWSISQGRDIWPLFDVNFSFFLFGLVFCITTVVAVLLPRRLNYQKK